MTDATRFVVERIISAEFTIIPLPHDSYDKPLASPDGAI